MEVSGSASAASTGANDTIARIEKVDGLTLHVSGLDAVDGTPVLDLKPCVHEFGPRGPIHQPDWASELMRHYWAPSVA